MSNLMVNKEYKNKNDTYLFIDDVNNKDENVFKMIWIYLSRSLKK